jgi:hypothetical protein
MEIERGNSLRSDICWLIDEIEKDFQNFKINEDERYELFCLTIAEEVIYAKSRENSI